MLVDPSVKKIRYLSSRKQRRARLEVEYHEADSFLRDMRAGNLRQGFVLSEDAFAELAEAVNTDKAMADEIAGNSILLLMLAVEGSEVDGLVAMAEVCREG